MHKNNFKPYNNQKQKPPYPSSKASKKMESLKSKLNEMSSRVGRGAPSNRTRSSTRRELDNLDEKTRVVMKMELVIKNSISRTKGMVFKQLSETMASQLKYKLACHKIKKVVEERCRKQYLKFLEKLLFVADIEIDLSERSSLFRSTLTYSMRDSSTSMFKKTNSIVKNYINDRSPDRKNKIYKGYKGPINGDPGKSYGKSIRGSLEKIVSEIQEFKSNGNPKSSRLHGEKGLSDWDDILHNGNFRSGRGGYNADDNDFQKHGYFKGNFLKGKNSKNLVTSYKQISGTSSGEGYQGEFSREMEMRQGNSKFKKKLSKLEEFMVKGDRFYNNDRIDMFVGFEKWFNGLEKIIVVNQKFGMNDAFKKIRSSMLNFGRMNRPLIILSNVFLLKVRKQKKFFFKKLKFFKEVENFQKSQKIKKFEKTISRLFLSRKHEAWRNMELCVIEFYLIAKLLQENNYKIGSNWKKKFYKLNSDIPNYFYDHILGSESHNRYIVRAAILNLTLKQILRRKSMPTIQKSFIGIVQSSMRKRRRQVNIEFGSYTIQKIFMRKSYEKIKRMSSVVDQKQTSFLIILGLLGRFERERKVRAFDKIFNYSQKIIKIWEGGRLLDGLVYQNDTYWLAEAFEGIIKGKHRGRMTRGEKIKLFVDMLERVEGCRMVEDLRRFFSLFRNSERYASSDSNYIRTSSDSDIIYEDANENSDEILDEKWMNQYIGMKEIEEENPIVELSELIQEKIQKDVVEALVGAADLRRRRSLGYRENLDSNRIDFLALERAKILFKAMDDPRRRWLLKNKMVFFGRVKRIVNVSRMGEMVGGLLSRSLTDIFKEIKNFDRDRFNKIRVDRQIQVMKGEQKIRNGCISSIFDLMKQKYLKARKSSQRYKAIRSLRHSGYDRLHKLNDFTTLRGEEIKLKNPKKNFSPKNGSNLNQYYNYSAIPNRTRSKSTKLIQNTISQIDNTRQNNLRRGLKSIEDMDIVSRRPPKPLTRRGLFATSNKQIKILRGNNNVKENKRIYIQRNPSINEEYESRRRGFSGSISRINHDSSYNDIERLERSRKFRKIEKMKNPDISLNISRGHNTNRILNYSSKKDIRYYIDKDRANLHLAKKNSISSNRLLNSSQMQLQSKNKRIFPYEKKCWNNLFEDKKNKLKYQEINDLEMQEDRLIRKYSGNVSFSRERSLKNSKSRQKNPNSLLRRSYLTGKSGQNVPSSSRKVNISTVKKKPPLVNQNIPNQRTISYNNLRQNLSQYYEEEPKGRKGSQSRAMKSSKKNRILESGLPLETPPRVFNSISGLGRVERPEKKGYYSDFVDSYIKKRRILG